MLLLLRAIRSLESDPGQNRLALCFSVPDYEQTDYFPFTSTYSELMRQIVLDTETTGLEPADGHRIIEIGCVEILNRKPGGSRFHVYLNPEREVDAEAVAVHGLSNEFLADKPRFADIAEDFMVYIKGAELIIHNAPFDVGFINHELQRWQKGIAPLAAQCSILDTLQMARKKHPGQRNNLDALCKRYDINNSHRDLHGALLDAEILAEVYLAMTGGQTLLGLESAGKPARIMKSTTRSRSAQRPPLRVVKATESEQAAHQAKLEGIDKASGGKCLWLAQPIEPDISV